MLSCHIVLLPHFLVMLSFIWEDGGQKYLDNCQWVLSYERSRTLVLANIFTSQHDLVTVILPSNQLSFKISILFYRHHEHVCIEENCLWYGGNGGLFNIIYSGSLYPRKFIFVLLLCFCFVGLTTHAFCVPPCP